MLSNRTSTSSAAVQQLAQTHTTSQHLQNKKVPIHEAIVTQGRARVRMVILIERAVCLEIRGQQGDGLVGENRSFVVKSVSLQRLPYEVVDNDPHWSEPVAGVGA